MLGNSDVTKSQNVAVKSQCSRIFNPIVLPTDPMIRVDLISGTNNGLAEAAGS